MMRTPVGSGESTIARLIGSGGSAKTARSVLHISGPLPSIGSPRPLMTRPSSSGPTRTVSGRPVPLT